MKSIVIIGAGFAGIRAALDLEKRYRRQKDIQITLISREPYHLFFPNLYEIATLPQELTTQQALAMSVAIPVAQVLKGKRIAFVQGEVEAVHEQGKWIRIGDKKIEYDYLIQGLGAQTNYYGIPGSQEFGIGLKSLTDAFKIRNKIEFVIQQHRQDVTKDYIRIVVAGGGFLGIELAAELVGFLDFLAWKNNYPRHKLHILIVEGSTRLLPGLDDDVAYDLLRRVSELGVHVQTNRFIAKVDSQFIEFKNGEKIAYDALLWAAGIQANSIAGTTVETDRMGRVKVGEVLQFSNDYSVLYIGDQACVTNTAGAPMPSTIPSAEAHGSYAAYAIGELLHNRKPKPFVGKPQIGYFITAGGRWAVLKSHIVYMKGWSAYMIRWLVYLHYFAGIIGWWAALELSLKEYSLFGRND